MQRNKNIKQKRRVTTKQGAKENNPTLLSENLKYHVTKSIIWGAPIYHSLTKSYLILWLNQDNKAHVPYYINTVRFPKLGQCPMVRLDILTDCNNQNINNF